MNREDKYILVKSKDGKVVRLYERDGILNCEIENRQNGDSSLSFTIAKNNPKCEFIKNPENVFIADGREYVVIKSDESFVTKRDNDNKLTLEIEAVESYYLLAKKYVTAYNSTTNYDHIDKHMVVVLSNGALGLNVNGVTISNPYSKGSAAYALYAVLYGSGWSVGTVDVSGTYDLETEKLSVLENVQEIQKLWGGILVWDSINKTVSLRDEEKYKPYNGFQLRYGKNIKGITVNTSADLVTRLYVYGKDNLNIASDNDGKEYIDDFRYTDKIYEGIAYNNDIDDPRELKNWGIKEIVKMCQPQITISAEMIDFREFPEYNQKPFFVNDIIDVIDNDVLDGEVYQARVIYRKYNFFEPYKCSIEVGSERSKFVDKLKYVLDTSDYVKKVYNPTNNTISSGNVDVGGVLLNKYASLTSNRITATESDIKTLYTKNIYVENLIATKASITDLNAANARITNLSATVANIDSLVATKASITQLQAVKADVNDLYATTANIQSLVATKASISDLNAANGRIDNLYSATANIQNLVAQKANISDLNATNASVYNLKVAFLNLNNLVVNGKASISQLEATNARINNISAGYEIATTLSCLNLNVGNRIQLAGATIRAERITIGTNPPRYKNVLVVN